MVSTMKMNACSGITRMWKQAHTTPNSSWPKAPAMPAAEVDGEAAAEHGEQQEDHFAGVEVSVQTQAQRHGARQVLDEVQQQVERHHPLAEGMREQFPGEAAEAFDLEAVEHHDQEHRDRHAEVMLRSVDGTTFRCSRPTFWPITGSRSTGTMSMKLNSRIQQKMVSASGAMSLLCAVEGVAHLGVDELHHDFDEVLELARHARRGLAGRHIEGDHEHQAEQHREEDAVDVEGPETLAVPAGSAGGERCIRSASARRRVRLLTSTLLPNASRRRRAGERRQRVRERDPVHKQCGDVGAEQRGERNLHRHENHDEQRHRDARASCASPT